MQERLEPIQLENPTGSRIAPLAWSHSPARIVTVAVCETQPLTAQGLAAVLLGHHSFRYCGAVASLQDARDLVLRPEPPGILILDKAFGVQAVLDWLLQHRSQHSPTSPVVWGLSISEAESLRLLQAGARGIVRKTAEPARLLSCLDAVASGSSWMEEGLFREVARIHRSHRSELTPREQQVMELVEQGFKNREIARQLGIRPGTVKIHLKHIFEKTGVRGRYGLALTGMKDKGILALP